LRRQRLRTKHIKTLMTAKRMISAYLLPPLHEGDKHGQSESI
jgi:hypothetical protein